MSKAYKVKDSTGCAIRCGGGAPGPGDPLLPEPLSRRNHPRPGTQNRRLPWFDLLPTDNRVESKAASGHRHVLAQMTAESRGDGGPAETHCECRDCGTELTVQEYCPRCGSEAVAEYQID